MQADFGLPPHLVTTSPADAATFPVQAKACSALPANLRVVREKPPATGVLAASGGRSQAGCWFDLMPQQRLGVPATHSSCLTWHLDRPRSNASRATVRNLVSRARRYVDALSSQPTSSLVAHARRRSPAPSPSTRILDACSASTRIIGNGASEQARRRGIDTLSGCRWSRWRPRLHRRHRSRPYW